MSAFIHDLASSMQITILKALALPQSGWRWKTRVAGDYGDIDLRQAVDAATAGGRAPALVTFGHMHQSLHKGYGAGRRNMVQIDQATGADSNHNHLHDG